MKILYVSDTYYPHVNGVYYFVQRLASGLQKKGHTIAVVAPSETMFSSNKNIDGIDVYGIPSFSILYYRDIRLPIPFLLQSHIKKILEDFEPDIIHVQSHFMLAKAVIKANKKFATPIIGTNHFMVENLTSFLQSEKWKRSLGQSMWRAFSKVFNKIDIVTTPTETAANLIRPKLMKDVIVISNGIEFEKFNSLGDASFIREKYGIPNKPILLYVGRLDPEKHINEIIEALPLTLPFIDIHLVIIGKGVKKTALEQLAKTKGVLDNITFTGFVPDNDLPYFYKQSQCFITASIAELQSIATLEAMASGLPVIAANAGALAELVKDTINGYLFNPGDVYQIAVNICKVFSNHNQTKKMGEKSQEFVAQHNIRHTITSFEKIYQLHCNRKIIQFTVRTKEAVS